MISKHITCKPGNDNYRRLANYIAGITKSQGVQFDERQPYIPEYHPGEAGDLAANRLRRLSECTLVHRTLAKGEAGRSEGLLSIDARSDYEPDDLVRRNPSLSPTGEKCLLTWTEGCWTEDDYESAIKEVVATQELNTRSKKEKTYHLIVSFRPEDQEKLTAEVFKEIEKRFAEALGLSEHQRHCGVHINTKNIHMHVAYNLIDKENFTRKEPWRDFAARDKLCRELEKEFGLTPDKGRGQGMSRSLSQVAAVTEAHSGEQSFESFAREKATAIQVEEAKNWQDLHQAFAKYGIELEKRGGGLAIRNKAGRQRLKASSMARDLTLKKLESRLGKFEPVKPSTLLPEGENQYRPKPIQKLEGENRFEEYAREYASKLRREIQQAKTWKEAHQAFARYGMKLSKRGAGLNINNWHGGQHTRASNVARELSIKRLEARFGKFEPVKDPALLPDSENRYGTPPEVLARKALWIEWTSTRAERKELAAAIKEKWKAYRKSVQQRPMGKKTRSYVLQLARQKEALELQRAIANHPKTWLEFLQQKAQTGNEKALAVLRSRKEEVQPEPIQDKKLEYLSRKVAISEARDLSYQTKQKLLGRVIIESIEEDVRTELDAHGKLIHSLKNGGIICDTGQTVSFSEKARTTVLEYMKRKWNIKVMSLKGRIVLTFPDGQTAILEKNAITKPKPTHQLAHTRGR